MKLTENLDNEARTKSHIQAMEIYLKGLFGAKGVVAYDYQKLTYLVVDSQTGDWSLHSTSPTCEQHSPYRHCSGVCYQSRTFQFPDKAQDILRNRFRLLSIWRPLFGPFRDYPLAVCGSRTVSEDDLVESDYIYPNFEGETFMVKANDRHSWYYMRDQDQNDALIITNYDSETGRRFPHSGFELPPDKTVTRIREL